LNAKLLNVPKEAYIPGLFQVFRRYGYDGATLSKIAEVTGLGKASLYHHFPGGKDEMVASVLDYSEAWLGENVLKPLASPGTAVERLRNMCDRVSDLYDGGSEPCLLAILQSGSGRDTTHGKVKSTLQRWIEAITDVLTETGMGKKLARQRGEDAIMAIQGALMLSQGLDDPAPFQRTIAGLPQDLVRDC
jgi:TetR/AcrR family transcriptional repressor of lmrAB and yxaGH operons